MKIADLIRESGHNIDNLDEDGFTFNYKGVDVAVIANQEQGTATFTAVVAKCGDFDEDKAAEVAFRLLDANTQISPFAFGILSSADDPDSADPREWPIVLTDTISTTNLDPCEVELTLTSLGAALLVARQQLAGSVAVSA